MYGFTVFSTRKGGQVCTVSRYSDQFEVNFDKTGGLRKLDMVQSMHGFTVYQFVHRVAGRIKYARNHDKHMRSVSPESLSGWTVTEQVRSMHGFTLIYE